MNKKSPYKGFVENFGTSFTGGKFGAAWTMANGIKKQFPGMPWYEVGKLVGIIFKYEPESDAFLTELTGQDLPR